MTRELLEKLGGLATGIGSLPYKDAREAVPAVLSSFPHLPHWPQLPQRSPLENMYIQFSRGFPGMTLEGGRIFVAADRLEAEGLESLYQVYLREDSQAYPLKEDYAQGFYAFLSSRVGEAVAVKGQVTGPVSMGLAIPDDRGMPLIYDDALADAIARFIHLQARWQEEKLASLGKTVIFLDEPYLSSYGSAYIPLSREKVVSLLTEAMGGVKGLKGLHCCGNTDWGLALATPVDILSFDAYNYARSLSLYPGEVASFLKKGGLVAWGIVPNDIDSLRKEDVPSLLRRLEEAMALLVAKGINRELLIQRSLITPCCGLGTLPPAGAIQAMQYTALLSQEFRSKYGLTKTGEAVPSREGKRG